MFDYFRKLFRIGGKSEEGAQATRDALTVPTTETRQTSEAATTPLSEEMLAEITAGSPNVEPAQLIVGIGRNVGRQRTNNEDSVFAFTATMGVESGASPFGIYVLADGMGGHRDGHLASETAVRTMGQYMLDQLYKPMFGLNPQPPRESLQEILRQGVNESNLRVVQNAPGGGTTLTAVLVHGTQMTVAHIGDSRAYAVFFDGRMQMLTRDHSLVKRLEELGQITAEEAANHPQKSMLYRALGQSEPQDPDIFTASLPHPGYLMLCSDGLWGVVHEDDIFRIIADAPSPHRACQNLVDAANAAGGPDNISVILVRMSD